MMIVDLSEDFEKPEGVGSQNRRRIKVMVYSIRFYETHISIMVSGITPWDTPVVRLGTRLEKRLGTQTALSAQPF